MDGFDLTKSKDSEFPGASAIDAHRRMMRERAREQARASQLDHSWLDILTLAGLCAAFIAVMS